MQSGDLIVSGKNSIHIPIDHLPDEVRVFFKDEEDMIPCNPHADSLEYSVHTSEHEHKHHHKFVLIINWSVSGVREIGWHVSF